MASNLLILIDNKGMSIFAISLYIFSITGNAIFDKGVMGANNSISSADDLLHDHPLYEDRAKNLRIYTLKAQYYYCLREVNPGYQAILKKNFLFAYQETELKEN